MHNVKRYFEEGNIYFLTHVTYERNPLLVDNVDLFWKAIERQQGKCAFELIAWVIIPDHLHLLINPLRNNPGLLTKNFKLSFASNLRARLKMYRGRIWHNRYWDHVIRDQDDINLHLDYIHYNPVKHRLVSRPRDYEHSSFRLFLSRGEYDPDWGCEDAPQFEGGYGE